eukprot:TRINITY_DN4432_c0_g1_i2.p1 TRINITY_DN4432_c0_g1~~TRINITY_DN4432_c0_g1_i2.p1  ORF type:complete len:328 (-),score=84.72 TRINITY_DN4432_c0_g1_i2:283-1188(-)
MEKLKIKITIDPSNSSTTYYKINLKDGYLETEIERRYSDFEYAQKKLFEDPQLKYFPIPSIPQPDDLQFAKKYIYKNSAEAQINERRWAFKRWLKRMFSNEKLHSASIFRDFFKDSYRQIVEHELKNKSIFEKYSPWKLLPQKTVTKDTTLEEMEKMYLSLLEISEKMMNIYSQIQDNQEAYHIEPFNSDKPFMENSLVAPLLESLGNMALVIQSENGTDLWLKLIYNLKYICYDFSNFKKSVGDVSEPKLYQDYTKWFLQCIDSDLKSCIPPLLKFCYHYHDKCLSDLQSLCNNLKIDLN